MPRLRPVLARAATTVSEAESFNTPHPDELKQRRASIEAELRGLDTQRQALSLKAVSGDQSSATAIESIDIQRQKLAAQIETINSALRTIADRAPKPPPPKPEAPRQIQLYELGDIAQMAGLLRVQVKEKRNIMVENIDRKFYEGMFAPAVLHYLDEYDPFSLAKAIIEPVMEKQAFTFDMRIDGDENRADREEREFKRKKNVDLNRLAQDLVEYAKLLPPHPKIVALMDAYGRGATVRQIRR